MAEPTAPKGAPLPRHFGHGPLAQRLAHEVFDSLLPAGERRSELHPKTTGRLGPALVVGVFGEWGAGKSYLLSEVGDELKLLREQRAKALAQQHPPGTEAGEPPTEITVLVEFNAWRFEREPHLLIPMLKVAEQALRKTLTQELPDDVRQREALSDRLALLSVLTQGLYDRGGREAIQLLLTAASSPVTLPKASKADGPEKPSLRELYKSTKASLDKARELPAGVTHESLYFGFYEHLSAITGRNPKALEAFRLRLTQGGIGWWPRLGHSSKQFLRRVFLGQARKPVEMTVNLIFMVDDLDRCLPEKAIEVLEAVKLFLDVEGCAFVLALDEEVVERGIAHRYQAYTSAAQGQTPITGAEYLEKLIHLPIRLPRPGGEDAQFYLAAHWPDLYAKAISSATQAGAQPEPNDLAQLVATLTPPVPRKLQRITSLVHLNYALAGQLEAAGGAAMPAVDQRRWLILMCALQLFAPALFRYLRVQGAWLMQELVQWRQTLRLGDLKKLSEELRQETQAVTKPYELRNAYARERLPELLLGSLSTRSGFSLLTWLEQVQEQTTRAEPDAKTLQRLLALAVAESGPASAGQATSPSNSAEVKLATAEAVPESDAGEGTDPSPSEPKPPAKPWPVSHVVERARLDNEFALWEPLAAGDAKAFEMAISREGAALAGKFLPESVVDRLSQPSHQGGTSWLAGPLDARHAMAQLLDPLLTQGDVFRLCKLGFETLGVFNRPSWGQVRRWEQSTPGSTHVPLATSPWSRPDGRAIELPLIPSIDGPTAHTLVSRRAWIADAVQGEMPGGSWALGADGDYGLYLDLNLRGVTQRLRWMEPGSFLMGSPEGQGLDDERPQHQVTISQGFWLADTPCTQALWHALMGSNPSDFREGPDSPLHPVENVGFDDVQAFINKLTILLPTGWTAELPSEANWEYACRAGTQTAYWWGDEAADTMANWHQQQRSTSPVIQYPPNPWGLHDMHGNVLEWCADGHREYSERAEHDPVGDSGDSARVVRGGSWTSYPDYARSACRDWGPFSLRSQFQGFRFALRSSNPGAELGRAAEPA